MLEENSESFAKAGVKLDQGDKVSFRDSEIDSEFKGFARLNLCGLVEYEDETEYEKFTEEYIVVNYSTLLSRRRPASLRMGLPAKIPAKSDYLPSQRGLFVVGRPQPALHPPQTQTSLNWAYLDDSNLSQIERYWSVVLFESSIKIYVQVVFIFCGV